jgi:hypothetical protein
MARQNTLRQIKLIVYRLKRNYGIPATLRKPIQNDYDVTTGEVTRQYEEFEILRAVVLPVDVARKFSYDLSFIAANRNFVYGGFYDVNDRVVLLDAKDLPADETIDLTWRMTIDGKIYEISAIEQAERKSAYVMKIKHTENITE